MSWNFCLHQARLINITSLHNQPRVLWLIVSIGLQGGWRWDLPFEVSNNSYTSLLFLCMCNDGSVAQPFLLLKALGKSSSRVAWLRKSWNLTAGVYMTPGVPATWTFYFSFFLLSISSFLFSWKDVSFSKNPKSNFRIIQDHFFFTLTFLRQ